MVSVRLTSVPETDGSGGAELGEVVLPPQPGITAPSANSETAWQVRAQNSRREDGETSRSRIDAYPPGCATPVPAESLGFL